MNELTPEAQAVLDAAVDYTKGLGAFKDILDAAYVYRASIKPPEPFTRYMWRDQVDGFGVTAAKSLDYWDGDDRIFEVLITPVKRVR